MRYFDCHSHFSTRAGLHHRTAEELANAERIFKRKRTFQTEAEMADGFRQRNVRSILDIYRTWRMTDEDEIRASNDYATAFARDNRDVVYGNWLAANPTMKDFWLKEYARLAASEFAASSAFAKARTAFGFRPAIRSGTRSTSCRSTPGVPVLLMTGLTGIGQGMPGGMGVVLEDGHPRHVDIVAARFPGTENSRRPAGVAVAGRHDRDPPAQGQRAVRGAWLVAEIFYAGFEEGNRRPSAGPHLVRLGLADLDA